jgi:AcrR family transcriptional regulator
MVNAEVDPRISRTRTVVLDATAALIGELGVGRTSIEAIAERSGVARSTIYRHWPNRPDLLVEAIRTTIALEPPDETGDLRHDLSVLLGGLANRLGSPQTGPIMMSLIAEVKRDPQMASVFTRFALERFGLIRSILEHAVERGELTGDVDPEQMTEDLVAPLFFRAFILSVSLDHDSVDGHIDRWIATHAS